MPREGTLVCTHGWTSHLCILALDLFRTRNSRGTTAQRTGPRHTQEHPQHTAEHKATPQKPAGGPPKGHQPIPWAYKARQKSVAQLVLAPWGRAGFCHHGTPRNTQNSATGTHGARERFSRTQEVNPGLGGSGISPPSLALAARDRINGFFLTVDSYNLLLTQSQKASNKCRQRGDHEHAPNAAANTAVMNMHLKPQVP